MKNELLRMFSEMTKTTQKLVFRMVGIMYEDEISKGDIQEMGVSQVHPSCLSKISGELPEMQHAIEERPDMYSICKPWETED